MWYCRPFMLFSFALPALPSAQGFAACCTHRTPSTPLVPASMIASAAVSALLPGTHGLVEKLSIIPRSGGALGFTYIPPKTEDRCEKSSPGCELARRPGRRASCGAHGACMPGPDVQPASWPPSRGLFCAV